MLLENCHEDILNSGVKPTYQSTLANRKTAGCCSQISSIFFILSWPLTDIKFQWQCSPVSHAIQRITDITVGGAT